MTSPLHTASDYVFDTHLEHFDRDVIEASRGVPMLVDFWADWCPPCRALTPVLERVVAHHARREQVVRLVVVEDREPVTLIDADLITQAFGDVHAIAPERGGVEQVTVRCP